MTMTEFGELLMLSALETNLLGLCLLISRKNKNFLQEGYVYLVSGNILLGFCCCCCKGIKMDMEEYIWKLNRQRVRWCQLSIYCLSVPIGHLNICSVINKRNSLTISPLKWIFIFWLDQISTTILIGWKRKTALSSQ